MTDITSPRIAVQALSPKTGTLPAALGIANPSLFGPVCMFIDVARAASFKLGGGGTYTGTSDANGYPTQVVSGQTSTQMLFDLGSGLHDWTGRQFTLTYDSAAGVNLTNLFNCTISTPVRSGNTYTATLTISGANRFWFCFARLDGAAGALDVTNVHLIRTGYTYSNGLTPQQMADAGHYIDYDFVKGWKQFLPSGKQVFFARGMDWSGVNGDVTRYSAADVPPLTKASWIARPPIEVICDFINQVNPRRYWHCFPINADSSYRRAVLAKLKSTVSTLTKVTLEISNEDWNDGFGQKAAQLANAAQWAQANSVSGIYVSAGATITNSTTLTLAAGEWAKVPAGLQSSAAIWIGGLRIHGKSSVSGDVLTFPGYDDITEGGTVSGTQTAVFIPYSMQQSYYALQLEAVRQDCEYVDPGMTMFETVIAAQQGSSSLASYFSTPEWLSVAPSRPAPAARHDAFSVSCYFGSKACTEAMVVQWQTDQAAAKAALHAAIMTTIGTMRANLAAARAVVDAYNPAMPIWPYEGGTHVQHSAMNNQNGLTGAAWTTYAPADALPLTTAWRADLGMQWEALTAYYAALRQYCGCATNYLKDNDPSQYGAWGLVNAADRGTPTDAYGLVNRAFMDALTLNDFRS